MSSFFTYYAEDGYYSLTKSGNILFVVIMAILVLLAAFLRTTIILDKESASSEHGKSIFSVRQLVFSAVALAIAFVLSYIKLVHMPWGGSVTLCSMLFVTLIGYWYGPTIGLTSALAYGILQFIQGGGGYILSPMQVAFDYILAFMALGLSGFFHNKKNGLLIGYLVSVTARGIFHSIGGYLYWMEYMPDNFPTSLTAVYPILYNFAYILPEAVITVVLISLPPVKSALARVKQLSSL